MHETELVEIIGNKRGAEDPDIRHFRRRRSALDDRANDVEHRPSARNTSMRTIRIHPLSLSDINSKHLARGLLSPRVLSTSRPIARAERSR